MSPVLLNHLDKGETFGHAMFPFD